jgi:hypothetical protein
MAITEKSARCRKCGWFLPEPPAEQACGMCGSGAGDPIELTALDRIYLLVRAAQRLRAKLESEAGLDDRTYWDRKLFNHYIDQDQQPSPEGFTVQTPIADMARKIKEESGVWRQAGCPV